MAYIGGIFAIYALLEHSNVFGSAETSNMILLVGNLLDGDLFHICIRIGNLLIYAAGIITALWMAKYHPTAQKLLCIALDAMAAVVLYRMPADTHPVIALYPVAFAMSVQWCSFRGVENNPSATTFSTGNFRQLVTHIFNYCTEKDPASLKNIQFYFWTMLSFHLGVATIYLLRPYLLWNSIWIIFIPLLAAAILEGRMVYQKSEGIEIIAQSAGSDEV